MRRQVTITVEADVPEGGYFEEALAITLCRLAAASRLSDSPISDERPGRAEYKVMTYRFLVSWRAGHGDGERA